MPRDTQQVSLRVETRLEKHVTPHKALPHGFPDFAISPEKVLGFFFSVIYRKECNARVPTFYF